MANDAKGGKGGWQHLVQQKLEELIKERGAEVAFAVPAVKLMILRFRQFAGKQEFGAAARNAVGFVRAFGMWNLRWGRKPMSAQMSAFVGELAAELGASLADWSDHTDDVKVADMIRETLQHPVVAGGRLGNLEGVLREIWDRLPGADVFIPELPEPDAIRAAGHAQAERIRRRARRVPSC